MLPSFQALLDALPGIAYVLDRDFRIVAYGRPNWDAAAAKGDAARLTDPANVLGHDVFGFIDGEEPRRVYRDLFVAVMNGNGPGISIEARCDTPECDQRTLLSIAPLAEGVLVHDLVVERSAPAARPAQLPFGSLQADEASLLMCSICKKIKDPKAGPWRSGMGAFALRQFFVVTQCICDSCFRKKIVPSLGIGSRSRH